jgi:hypothetical protein
MEKTRSRRALSGGVPLAPSQQTPRSSIRSDQPLSDDPERPVPWLEEPVLCARRYRMYTLQTRICAGIIQFSERCASFPWAVHLIDVLYSVRNHLNPRMCTPLTRMDGLGINGVPSIAQTRCGVGAASRILFEIVLLATVLIVCGLPDAPT